MSGQTEFGFADADDIPNPDGPRGDLPVIQLPSGSFTITESAEKLFSLIAPLHKLFVRGDVVITLGQNENGLPILRVLKPEEARSEFEKFGQLKVASGKKGGLKHSLCSKENASALLCSSEAGRLLPKIRGLINCPVIYESSGELSVAGLGYNPQIEKLVTCRAKPEEVGFETAKSALLGLLQDFSFQSEGDKSRALASFIAPAFKLGGLLKYRVPADVAEADKSQSGKTYRQKLIAAIYDELVSVIANREGGVGSLDESFSYQLLQGRPFIQFDNLRGKLNSQLLEAFFSAEGKIACRVPFRSFMEVYAEDFFIFITSNGFETTRDFANRSSIIRIRKQPQDFKYAVHEEGDLLAHIRAKQPFYLGCVFSVIRAWHQAGKPRTEEFRHDFKEWAQLMDWVVQNLFDLAPLMDGHQQAQQSVSSPDMVFLRQVAIAVGRVEALDEPQSATDIAGISEAEGIEVPGGKAGWDAEGLARKIGVCFSRTFGDEDNIEIEGYSIERQVVEKKRPDGNGNMPVKSYVFRRLCEVKKKAEKKLKPAAGKKGSGFGKLCPSLAREAA